uniref:FAD-binding FR-type domain-containing protein n=2 Tax=Rhodosorus marinus TaxID=101924 RepID=A0A7S3ECE9_9RHOD|mmetsp:Transcript_22696/g.90916  ORF Transcript_22696/g.90916 Transcript_22696/m.90916 type:complete len:570 (+) Transcript_22696:49-1758(+)
MGGENLYSFHEGELIAQGKDGTRRVATKLLPHLGTSIDVAAGRDEFFRERRVVYASSMDEDGYPWVSEVTGPAGFLDAPDEHTAILSGKQTSFLPEDPILTHFRTCSDRRMSIMVMDFEKRIRYRANGNLKVPALDMDLVLDVAEGIPGCPKYIQRRRIVGERQCMEKPATRGETLSVEAIEVIEKSNTTFLGTVNPTGHCDLSHRGGFPGFVVVNSGVELVIPEYGGNGLFTTLGNLELCSRAGLIFVDYEGTGNVVQVVGDAFPEWENAEYEGAGRLIRFHVKEFILHHGASRYKWEMIDYSDFNPAHGRARGEDLPMQGKGLFPMDMVLVDSEAMNESGTTKRFTLWGNQLIPYTPGQYATFTLSLPSGKKLERSWTITSVPTASAGDHKMEITVKHLKGGEASTYLHEAEGFPHVQLIAVGGELSPYLSGVPELPKQVILISAGIGITPMMAIARSLRDTDVEVTFIHSERHEKDRAFADELSRLKVSDGKFKLATTVTDPEEPIKPGVVRGRITRELLQSKLTLENHDYQAYICGPGKFIGDVCEFLSQLNVQASRIHTEEFIF